MEALKYRYSISMNLTVETIIDSENANEKAVLEEYKRKLISIINPTEATVDWDGSISLEVNKVSL